MLSRQLLESEIMEKPPLFFKLWNWILLQANHRESKGQLQRGELVATLQDLIGVGGYRVGYRREHPTKKQVRAALDWFREQNMIKTRKTTRGMIITVLKYDLYQNPDNYKEPPMKVRRRAPEGHSEGHDEGHSETLASQGSEPDTGHSGGHGEGNAKGAEGAHDRQEGNNDKKGRGERGDENLQFPSDQASPAIRDLLSRIENQTVRDLVEKSIQLVAMTRKSGKMADSVTVRYLQYLLQFKEWQIGTAITKYIEGQYWLDRKGENYLMGILRNVGPRDYHEVIQKVSGQNQPQNIQPRNYREAQDAEHRTVAMRWLNKRKAKEGDHGVQGSDPGGAGQTQDCLPAAKNG